MKNHFLSALLLVVFSVGFNGKGQDTLTERPYFERFDDFFLVKAGINNRSLNYNLSPRVNGVTQFLQRLWYRPAVQNTLGVGVRFKGVGVSVGFKLIQHPAIKARQGDSDYFDIRVGSMGYKLGWEINYQDYKGYFVSDLDLRSLNGILGSASNLYSGDTLLRRDDLRTQNFTANFHYIFNSDKFSYRAAFVLDQRQLRSGGSFLLNGSVGYFRASADTNFVLSSPSAEFDPNARYRRTDFYTASVIPGYAYNLVFGKGWYVTLGVSAFASLMYYDLTTGTSRDEAVSYLLKGVARGSAGFHGKRWVFGVSGYADLQGMNTPYVQFRPEIFDLMGFVAYRFPVKWLAGKKSFFELLEKKNRNPTR